jgi:hypothetical protein
VAGQGAPRGPVGHHRCRQRRPCALIAWRAAASAEGGVLKFVAVPERLLALARLTEAESLLA